MQLVIKASVPAIHTLDIHLHISFIIVCVCAVCNVHGMHGLYGQM